MAPKGRAEGAGCLSGKDTEGWKRRKKNTRKCQQEKRDGSTPEKMPVWTKR